jgi:hypothetical protein
MPEWLRDISVLSLIFSFICMIVIVIDIAAGNRQKMWIMNIVLPVTALYSGPFGLIFYYKVGRLSAITWVNEKEGENRVNHAADKPFWMSAAVSSTHCGAGCSLGDLSAEWIFLFIPFTVFGQKLFGAWVVDYVFALLFGIAFQYFSIKPMRNLSVKEAVTAAVKADILSLTSWQIGMYGWMAAAVF